MILRPLLSIGPDNFPDSDRFRDFPSLLAGGGGRARSCFASKFADALNRGRGDFCITCIIYLDTFSVPLEGEFLEFSFFLLISSFLSHKWNNNNCRRNFIYIHIFKEKNYLSEKLRRFNEEI